MKKLFLFAGLFLAITSVNAQNTDIEDEGVVINGVKWATRNLDAGGKFVENQEDYGAYFQWGRPADGHENPASGTTEELANSDTPGNSLFILLTNENSYGGGNYDWRSPQNNTLWNTGTESAPVKSPNDPSPDGWRVPTNTEMESLLDESKVSRKREGNGYTFTDITGTETDGNSVFLPAAGNRSIDNGRLYSAGDYCYYWSSTPSNMPKDDVGAYHLSFQSEFARTSPEDRAAGLSVRPVAENSGSTATSEILSDGRTITGYYSIMGIKLQDEPASGMYIVVYDNGEAKKVVRQ